MIGFISVALAQDPVSIDAETFRASSDAYRTVMADEAGLKEGWTTGAALHYQRSPLVYELSTGRTHLVRDALALDLSGSFSVWRLRLGLTAPAYLVVTSDNRSTRTVLGDAGLHGKAWLWGVEGKTSANVALLASLDLPLGAHRHYLGSTSVAFRAGLAADFTQGPVFVIANGGVHLQAPQEATNIRLGHQIFIRGALGVEPVDRLAIAAEVFSRISVLPDSSPDETAEILLGIHRTGTGVNPYGSAGASVTRGIGSPLFRAMVGVRIAPRPPAD